MSSTTPEKCNEKMVELSLIFFQKSQLRIPIIIENPSRPLLRLNDINMSISSKRDTKK